MKAWIERLTPQARRNIVIAAVASVAVVLLMLFMPKQEKQEDKGEPVVSSVLSGTDTRSLGIEALAARLRDLEKEKEELNEKYKKLQEELASKNRDSQGRDQQEIERLQKALEKEREEREQMIGKLREELQQKDRPGTDEIAGPEQMPEDTAPPQEQLADLYAQAPVPQVMETPSGAETDSGNKNAPRIQVIEQEETEKPQDTGAPEQQYLPAGSIVSVTSLSGMDAPTGDGARRDPFPILLRIKHEALLPNRFRQDVRECFMTASGYGDLSSERAYLRAEMISCVREDGGVIEQRIEAFAVGEDGKAGIRGRVVSRQGQLIAKSLMAGFLQGVSEMFNINPVPVIATDDIGDTQEYQRVLSSDAIQGAAVKGAGKAMERIADYYIDMAEDMYPIIEIDAGRRIDFIVQSGVKLDAK